MSDYSIELRFAADHPALAGHFPGNPVVPAVLILDAIYRRVTESDHRWQVFRLRHAKFPAPLRPDETAIATVTKRAGCVHFSVRRGADIIAVGEFVRAIGE